MWNMKLSVTFRRTLPLLAVAGTLSACQGALDGVSQKANAPVPKQLVASMKAQGMALTSPIMLRIFKQENTLEVWKKKDSVNK